MFDVGWSEMLVIAVVMIVVVGPKDLPRMLRTIGKMTAKVRSMAGDFQKQFNEALKEAELDEVKKSVDSLKSLNPAAEIRKQINPFEKAAADVRAGLQSVMAPKAAESGKPASPVAHEAEPLKAGAAALPGEGGTPAAPAASAVAAPAAPAAPVAPVVSAAPVASAEAGAPKRAAAARKTAAASAAKGDAAPAAAKAPAKRAAPATKSTGARAKKPSEGVK
jgi:sec-independent protein translocase protein TatB